MVGHPSSGGVTIKKPYGVDVFLYQPASHPIFPLGLVTEFDVIIRLVETGLGRLRLVEAVIRLDAYRFFWHFETSPITLRMQEVFFGCTVLPDSTVINLRSSNQEASQSAVKNAGVDFSYFSWCGYFQGPSLSVACYKRCNKQHSVSVTKVTSKIGFSSSHCLTSCIWLIFNLMFYDHITKRM